jgi:ubiquinone/menaquinone biosynthesis C-methylase UbiE
MANSENLMDVRSAYDTVAETYSTVIPDTSFEAPLDMAMVDHFIAHVRATADRTVVDVGCGAGRMTSYLSHAGLNVSGVDLSPEMVRVAHRLHPELLFDVGELTDLPVADAGADGVLAWYSIIHSPPTALPAIAGEFWRALRPGGSALIAFHAGSGHRTIDRAYGHDVQLRAELHAPDDVALRFTEQGFVMRAQLVRSPRATEKHPQAAILVDKPFLPS